MSLYIKELARLATECDRGGLHKEANRLDGILRRISGVQRFFYKTAGHKKDLIRRYPKYRQEIKRAVEFGIKPTYLGWVVLQLQQAEPFGEIISLLKSFEKYKPRLSEKDIYKYATLGELRAAIEEGGPSRSEMAAQTREKIASEYEMVYEDEQIKIVHPQSADASKHFGQGTRWCISATVSSNYFESYSKQNIFFYFIISKGKVSSDGMEKIAYSVAKTKGKRKATQIYNAKDNRIKEGQVQKFLGHDKYQAAMSAIDQSLETKEHTKVNEVYASLTPEQVDLNFAHETPGKRFNLKWKLLRHKYVKDEIKEHIRNKFTNITVQEFLSWTLEVGSVNEAIALRFNFLRDKHTSSQLKSYIRKEGINMPDSIEKLKIIESIFIPDNFEEYRTAINQLGNDFGLVKDFLLRMMSPIIKIGKSLKDQIFEDILETYKEYFEGISLSLAHNARLNRDQANKILELEGHHPTFKLKLLGNENVSSKFKLELLSNMDKSEIKKVAGLDGDRLYYGAESFIYSKILFPTVKSSLIDFLTNPKIKIHFNTARKFLTQLRDPDVDKAVLALFENGTVNIFSIYATNSISKKRPDLEEFFNKLIFREITTRNPRDIAKIAQNDKFVTLSEDNQRIVITKLISGFGRILEGDKYHYGATNILNLKLYLKTIRKRKELVDNEQLFALDRELADGLMDKLFNSDGEPKLKSWDENTEEWHERYRDAKYTFLRYLLITDLGKYFSVSAGIAKKILKRDFVERIRSDRSLNSRTDFRKYSIGINDFYGNNPLYGQLGLYEKDGAMSVDLMEEYLIENIHIKPEDFIDGFMAWSVENLLEDPDQYYDDFDFNSKIDNKDFRLGYAFHQDMERNLHSADLVGRDIDEYPEMTQNELEYMRLKKTELDESDNESEEWFEEALGFGEDEEPAEEEVDQTEVDTHEQEMRLVEQEDEESYENERRIQREQRARRLQEIENWKQKPRFRGDQKFPAEEIRDEEEELEIPMGSEIENF